VLVVSGHAESAWRPALDGLPPGSVTVVVLMGLAARAAVAAGLIERGWAADTPAAVLWAASTPESAAWTGTLSALGTAPVPEAAADAPATLVVGKVVALARVLGMDRASTEAVEAQTNVGRGRTT
jgi:siroheme synthase